MRCDSGEIEITDNIVIDGGGVDDCITVERGCSLIIDGSVKFSNCPRCIVAEGTAEIMVLAESQIICDALQDGIVTRDDSIVNLDALTFQVGIPFLNISRSGVINLSGLQNGSMSEGDSLITLDGAVCTVTGGERAIVTEGGSAVDTADCIQVFVNEP